MVMVRCSLLPWETGTGSGRTLGVTCEPLCFQSRGEAQVSLCEEPPPGTCHQHLDFWWEDEEKDQSLDWMLPCPVDQRIEDTLNFLWGRRYPTDLGQSWPGTRGTPTHGNRSMPQSVNP